jgi:hypothetical protein
MIGLAFIEVSFSPVKARTGRFTRADPPTWPKLEGSVAENPPVDHPPDDNGLHHTAARTSAASGEVAMDALELWMLRYDAVHDGFVPDLFKGLSDAQVRARPAGVNSVAWLVWHLTRVQDAVMSRLVEDRPQILDEGGWSTALRVDRRDVGSGMTPEDVAALSTAIDTEALRAYRRAVVEFTRQVATSLPPAAWGDIVPEGRVRRVVAEEGLLVEAGSWVGDFWARGLSRGWYLLQVGLLHPYGHCFEAEVTRGLLGIPGR